MPVSEFEERFQITMPTKDEAGEEWSWPVPHVHYPNLPVEALPTTGIYAPVHERNQMALVTAAETDVSKVQSPMAFKEGFTKHPMKGTDDLYTGEHADGFYSDSGGFCERMNLLDRL